jgi:hypothetical protein
MKDMTILGPDSETKPGKLSVLLAIPCVVSAFAAFYYFGFHELWCRSAGLVLTLIAGVFAWSVYRIRVRAQAHLFMPTRGYSIPILFALCGVAGFFMAEESRGRLAWFAIVFLRRLANRA